MRLNRRTIAAITLVLAIFYAHDMLRGNFTPFFNSVSLLHTMRRIFSLRRGFNIRSLSMINRGINSIKNQKYVENLVKNHQKKKPDKSNNKTKAKKDKTKK